MQATPKALKRQLRSVIEWAAGTLAPIGWRARRQPALVILMYHRVLPEGDPRRAVEQPGMWVSPATLDMHLRVLRRHFELVQLEDWLADRAAGRELPRRACAITFDDGWRDNFEFAFPVLLRHQAPATIFLVSDLVGSRYSFWPNRLAAALRALATRDDLTRWPSTLVRVLQPALGPTGWPPAEDALDRAIVTCKESFPDADMIRWLDAVHAGPAAGERDLLDWREIGEMAASGLVRFGSHSRRHTRLVAGLDEAIVADEVAGSKRALEVQLRRPVRLFCYPNGDRCDVAERLVRADYAGAALTTPGWNDVTADACRLRRVGVHEDMARTPGAFLSRLAGLP